MRIIILFFLFFVVVSCNPNLHIQGKLMRDMNTSKNGYTKNKPYIKRLP